VSEAQIGALLPLCASMGKTGASRGAAPPRHSTQCQPPASWEPVGESEALRCAGLAPGVPTAEHTWCKSDVAGPVDHSGASTATASASMHQDTAAPASARLRRKVWRSVGLGYMVLLQATAILPR
jgi:hypothetical protein